MTRDAIVALELPRDPTMRVVLPERSREPAEGNALSPEELVRFLAAMCKDHAQHYPRWGWTRSGRRLRVS
jgi:hypothetical protein